MFKRGQEVHGVVLISPTEVLDSSGGPRRAWVCRLKSTGEIKVIREYTLNRRSPGLKTSQRHVQLNRVYHNYVGRSKKKNVFFGLTHEEFYALVDQPCVYCKSPPSNGGGTFSKAKYSGIDRVDQAQGYTKSNCVPCCARCNSIKSDHLSYEEMVAIGEVLRRFKRGPNQSK